MSTPTTFFGLLMFIGLFIPGMTYVFQRETDFPTKDTSAIREAARLISSGLAADFLAAVIFGIWHSKSNGNTSHLSPNRWLDNPTQVLKDDLGPVVWCAVIFFSLACLIAFALGRLMNWATLREWKPFRLIFGAPQRSPSSWAMLFSGDGRDLFHVGCSLVDGSYVSGMLFSFSADADTNLDRTLALRQPIKFRSRRGQVEESLSEISTLSVAARDIRLLTVTYLSQEPEAEPVPEPSPKQV